MGAAGAVSRERKTVQEGWESYETVQGQIPKRQAVGKKKTQLRHCVSGPGMLARSCVSTRLAVSTCHGTPWW